MVTEETKKSLKIPIWYSETVVRRRRDNTMTKRLTRRVSLVEQELFTLPEHLSSPLVLSGVLVARSLVLCVCFVDRCWSFCPFSFGHCVVCPSIYEFWLPLWYIISLTLLTYKLHDFEIQTLKLDRNKWIKEGLYNQGTLYFFLSYNWCSAYSQPVLPYLNILAMLE